MSQTPTQRALALAEEVCEQNPHLGSILVEVIEKLEKESFAIWYAQQPKLKQRAEAAEARVKELEATVLQLGRSAADLMMSDHADHYYEQWEAAQEFTAETKGTP